MALITDVMAGEAGRLDKKILHINRDKPSIESLVKKEFWEKEMGDTHTVLTYERSGLSATTSWTALSQNAGAGNTCAPTATQIDPAYSTDTYGLAEIALESHRLCVKDIHNVVMFGEQLSNVYRNLADNTRWEMESRHRSEFTRLAQHKIILESTGPTSDSDATTWGTTAAGRFLSMGVLKKYGRRLSSDAGVTGAITKKDGAPVWLVITSQETYDGLKLGSDDLRSDIREGGRNGELLAAMGITHSYNGFVFMIDNDLARYTHTGSSYVSVSPYADDATVAQGTARIRNTSYDSATYEDTIIWHPDVYTCQTPQLPTSPGGNTNFPASDYMGSWRFVNDEHHDTASTAYNPDKKWGFFRGLLASASKPGLTQYGYVIRHLVVPFSDQSRVAIDNA